ERSAANPAVYGTVARHFLADANRAASASPCLISTSRRSYGSAPGSIEPSAKIIVGVATTLSFLPSAAVAAIGLSQSPLTPVGSEPVAKKSSHAFALSGAHQITRDLRAASGWS